MAKFVLFEKVFGKVMKFYYLCVIYKHSLFKTILLETKMKKRIGMKKTKIKLLVLGFFLFAFCATATAPLKKDVEMKDVLFSSIAWIESSHNPKAKSRDGSVGIVQIKPVMVKEVNRICQLKGIDKHFSLADRQSKSKSKQMFWIYQKFYNPNVNFDQLSQNEMEVMARKWNGGPKGHVKNSTKKYWRKVEKRMGFELEYGYLSNLD